MQSLHQNMLNWKKKLRFGRDKQINGGLKLVWLKSRIVDGGMKRISNDTKYTIKGVSKIPVSENRAKHREIVLLEGDWNLGGSLDGMYTLFNYTDTNNQPEKLNLI